MEANENIKIVEINGVKIEVDLRTCKVIENYKVGDRVKVLIKDYSGYNSYAGVIIGFDDFQKLPTMIIAYLKQSYSSAEINWVYLNAETKDIEICPANALDKFLDKSHALNLFDKEIAKKELELIEIKNKREYFQKEFASYFGEVKV